MDTTSVIATLRKRLFSAPAYEDSNAKTAAVLLPILQKGEDAFLLLQVRSQNVYQPGEICLPGGHTEGNESPIETALRETEEEMGICGELFDVLGYLAAQKRRSGLIVYPVLATAKAETLPPLSIDPHEVAEVFSLPISFLLTTPAQQYHWDPEKTGEEELPPILFDYINKYSFSMDTWYWEYEGKGIWGLTAGMLKQLVDLLSMSEDVIPAEPYMIDSKM